MDIFIQKTSVIFTRTLGAGAPAVWATNPINPDTLVQSLGNKAFTRTLDNPTMGSYTGFTTGPGNNAATPQLGIKIARNGAWLPFAMKYARIGFANRIFATALGGSPSLWNLTDITPTYPVVGTKEYGIGLATDGFVGGGGNYVTNAITEKLNVSPGSSQNVHFAAQTTNPIGYWGNLYSADFFQTLIPNFINVRAIEPVIHANNVWDEATFATTLTALLAGGLIGPPTFAMFCTTMTEYYQITVDNQLLQNLSVGAQDAFIIVPNICVMAGTVGDGAGKSLPISTQCSPTFMTAGAASEKACPLAWLQTKSGGPSTASSLNSPSMIPVATGTGSYDGSYSSTIFFSLNPIDESKSIQPIPSNFTGTTGPY